MMVGRQCSSSCQGALHSATCVPPIVWDPYLPRSCWERLNPQPVVSASGTTSDSGDRREPIDQSPSVSVRGGEGT